MCHSFRTYLRCSQVLRFGRQNVFVEASSDHRFPRVVSTGAQLDLGESMMDFTSGIDGSDTIVTESTIPQTRSRLPSFFDCWSYTFRKPLLNKNNRNVDGMELLTSLLPRSYFVVVQRDPFQTVQSLLAARKFDQGSSTSAWGLYSDCCDPDLNAIEGTCEQVAIGRKRIREQLKNVEPSRFLEVDYEQFCASPATSIARIAERVTNLEIRDADSKLPSLRASNKITLSDNEHRRVDRLLKEFGA